MASSYPGGLDSFVAKIDDITTVAAADVNDLQDAVVAIETELGTDPGSSILPVGTVMIFSQASPPTGWTQTADNDQVLRVVSGSGGGTGGSVSIDGGSITSGTAALSVAQLAAHAHASGSTLAFTPSGSGTNVRLADGGGVDGETVGSGSTHSHSGTYNIKFRNVITATRD